MVKFGTVLLFILGLVACVKDKPYPEVSEYPNSTHQGVWVLNEGIYGNANADLSFIDLSNGQTYNNLYRQANGQSLGDVAQDIQRVHDHFWISVNNSNKIVVVDTATFQEVATMSDIHSPRYITEINDSLIAVSSLHSKHLYFIHSKTFQVIKTVDVDYEGTEHMLVVDQTLYVTNWNENSHLLYKINTVSLVIEDRIQLIGLASHDIIQDADDNIWVLSGNKYKNIPSHLQIFNAHQSGIGKHFAFPTNDEPMRLTCDANKKQVYFLKVNYTGQSVSNGVFTMAYQDSTLPSTPLIQANPNSYFYALGIHPITHTILVSDANGFNQKSTIYSFALNGNPLNNYACGFGSNKFLFR